MWQMQQQFQQAAPQGYQGQPLPQQPQNAADLRNLLQQFGDVLSPQNRQFIQELIVNLEQGGDQQKLMDLAARMQQATPPRG